MTRKARLFVFVTSAATNAKSQRWEHIDLDKRVAHLPMTKNGSCRDVPLSTHALETLRGLQTGESATVFTAAPNAVRLAWGA